MNQILMSHLLHLLMKIRRDAKQIKRESPLHPGLKALSQRLRRSSNLLSGRYEKLEVILRDHYDVFHTQSKR